MLRTVILALAALTASAGWVGIQASPRGAPVETRARPAQLGFYNGGEWVRLDVDPGRIGLRLAPGIDEASARALVAGLDAVAPTEATRFRWAEGALLQLETRGGMDADGALAAAAELRRRPGVRSASPCLRARGEPWFLTERVLVRWLAGTPAAVVAALTADLALVDTIDYVEGAASVYRVPGGTDALALANELYRSGLCDFALPDFAVTRRAHADTDDPLFALQWHLEHSGDQDLDARAAWDVTRGDPSVIVAVIDTGFELTHPDLVPNLVPGIDVLEDDNDPQAEDFPNGVEERHGTAVAGIAAARGNNGVGVTGVAQHCGLMPIRYFSEYGPLNPTLADEAEAFNFARQNGAAVINASWGPPGGNGILPVTTQIAIDECNTFGRGGKGCLVFFASGNSVGDIASNGYASYPGTIAVGAVTNQGLRPSYSGWGDALDLCAPSHGGTASIWTTDRLGAAGYGAGDYDGGFGGTSAASPGAAGVAALILSANPALTREEAILILKQSAEKVDLAGGTYDASGHSRFYGHGRVNAAAALALAGGGYCGIERVCAAPAPNSTGNAVKLDAGGTTSVAANNLTFFASQLPPFTDAVMVYSPDAQFSALGDGWLCLGNGSYGFVLRLGMASSDVFGSFFQSLDNQSPPHPLGQITQGTTWRFQLWYRDLAGGGGGGGFNFSDALSVTFCP